MRRGNDEQLRPGGVWSKVGTSERSDRHESRRQRPVLFESIGSHGFDSSLRSDNWEVSADRSTGGEVGCRRRSWPARVPVNILTIEKSGAERPDDPTTPIARDANHWETPTRFARTGHFPSGRRGPSIRYAVSSQE